MRTNIEIEDALMEQATLASGGGTKKAIVETALRLLVETRSQGAFRRMRGTVQWKGDLPQSRLGRSRE